MCVPPTCELAMVTGKCTVECKQCSQHRPTHSQPGRGGGGLRKNNEILIWIMWRIIEECGTQTAFSFLLSCQPSEIFQRAHIALTILRRLKSAPDEKSRDFRLMFMNSMADGRGNLGSRPWTFKTRENPGSRS